MNENDNTLWHALGLGPQWHLKTAPSATQAANSGVLMVGDFGLSMSSQTQIPEGQAGTLLLNMLASIDCSPDQLTLLSLRQGLDLKNYLQQTPFSHLILMGDDAVAALFGSPGNVETHQGVVHELELPQCKSLVVVLPALTDLIARPVLKAKAWAALCLIRARFLLQH